jgi:recombinational DNA repair protein (RecF pathway)
MKGFIIALRRAKNEDMIVTILSNDRVGAYYRFYGARHSILQLGHLIDFEIEGEQSNFMPRVRAISHIGFDWIYDNNRLLMWHNYIKLYEPHLKDANELGSFYYDLLLSSAQKWHLQNPKRIVCEDYLKILIYEGRLHDEEMCYICEEKIEEEISLMQAFIPAHPKCIYAPSLKKSKILTFFETQKSIFLDEAEVDLLHSIVMRGL